MRSTSLELRPSPWRTSIISELRMAVDLAPHHAPRYDHAAMQQWTPRKCPVQQSRKDPFLSWRFNT